MILVQSMRRTIKTRTRIKYRQVVIILAAEPVGGLRGTSGWPRLVFFTLSGAYATFIFIPPRGRFYGAIELLYYYHGVRSTPTRRERCP
jgi:hypothetical protein